MAQANPNPVDHLAAEAFMIAELGPGTRVIDATHIGAHAIELAANNWAVGPLCHRHPQTNRVAGPHGKTPVPHLVPHGVLEFTTDISTVARWWATGDWNIGIRVPETMFVLDADNLDALAALVAEHGPIPDTMTTVTGRAEGGRHFYLRRPAGSLTMTRLPKGIEIKTSTGYVVAPPSIHPDTGKQYTRIDGPIAEPPQWLIDLIRPEPITLTPRSARRLFTHTGPSIADDFCTSATWADVLNPHGWTCLDADPDADGARWRHPTATSPSSATVRNGCLFIFSPNTPFDITEGGNPHGYTKFRAYAILEHDGDLKAAARALAVTK